MSVHTVRRREDERGAALGLQAQRWNPGKLRELVAPGAGGVDQDGRLDAAQGSL
ncbi:hypothetical protein D3C84_1100620 [compost metagenome]